MINESDIKPFSNSLKTVSKLYQEVKDIVLLVENQLSGKEVVLSSINELRNAFDHIMRCYYEDELFSYHTDKAIGHIYRAGYDSYELLAIEKAQIIKDILVYDAEVIVSVFPDYYKRILPSIKRLEEKLSDARANKKVNNHNPHTGSEHIEDEDIESAFKDYEDIATELLKIEDEIMSKIQILEEAKKDISKKVWKERAIGALTAFFIGIIILLIQNAYDETKEAVPTQDKTKEALPKR